MHEILIDRCINRIRLEFKETSASRRTSLQIVLIESDWNLKRYKVTIKDECGFSINRIRLEFKAGDGVDQAFQRWRINRIRLEFKAFTVFVSVFSSPVLIESDWNLKHIITFFFS